MPQLRHLTIHLSSEINAAFSTRSIEVPDYMFDYFAKEFCPQKSETFRKVVIELCKSENSVECLLDIMTVKRAIPVEEILNPDRTEQNTRLLEIVVAEMASLGNQFGWDAEQAFLAGQRVREHSFVYRGKWKTAKRSPDRSRTAHLWIEYPSTIDIYLIVSEKLGAEKRILVCKGHVGFPFASAACAELLWLDSTRVRIMQDNKRDYWIYDCSNGQLVFHYPRAENGDAHGVYDFACMYFEGRFVEQNRDLGVEWLRKSALKGYKHAITHLDRIERSNQHVNQPSPYLSRVNEDPFCD
jgi:hypothetical protein